MDNPSINGILLHVQKNHKEKRIFFDISPEIARKNRIWFTVGIRIFIIFTQILFNVKDFSTDAFKGVPFPSEDYTVLDNLIRRLLRGFTQWDAAHMLHIAEYGYVLENSLAFFPLFPMVVRSASYWAIPLTYFNFLHVSTAQLLTAVVLNMWFFYLASECVFECVEEITRSVKQAQIATTLFAINPASVFFTSVYSESMYCFFTLMGIRRLVKRDGNFWSAYFSSVFFFALSYLTRSNGILNFGYVGFYCLLNAVFVDENGKGKTLIFNKDSNTIITQVVLFVAQCTIAAFSIILPVSFYGSYQQQYFCNPTSRLRVPEALINLAAHSNVAIAGDIGKITWCNASNSIYPSFYSAIQAKYWDVSLFGYWQVQKVPCFLLAAPAFIIVVYGALLVWKDLNRREKWLQYFVDGGELVSYTIHAIFIGFGALFYYNVEVFTRIMFSSSLFPYLVVSRWMADSTPQVRWSDLLDPVHMPFISHFASRGWPEKAAFLYFIGYAFLGSTLHIMGLPFT